MKTTIILGIVLALLLVSCSDKPAYNPEQVPTGGGCGVTSPDLNYDCYAGIWQDSTEVPIKETKKMM